MSVSFTVSAEGIEKVNLVENDVRIIKALFNMRWDIKCN